TIKKTDFIQQRWLDNDFIGMAFSIVQPEIHKLQFTFGGAVNKYLGYHFGKVIWAKYASNSNINYEWYRGKGNKTDANLYVKTKWEIINHLYTYVDIQARTIYYEIKGIDKDFRDITQNHEFMFFNPKLGAVYQINTNQKTYISFAVGNREPSRKTLVDANPLAPKPQPEQLFDYELGYEYRNSKYLAGLNLYMMNYHNQLVMTGEINDVGEPVLTNVPTSYRRGIEVIWGAKVLNTLTLSGNAGFSINKIKGFTEYVDDWDNWGTQRKNYLGTTDISFSPPIVLSNIISWEPFKNINLSLATKYVSKQYIDNTSNDDRVLDPYLVNNLYLSYIINTNLFKEAQLKFNLINIFNVMYETNAWVYRYYYNNKEENLNGYFPQAGRHFLIGIDIKI
ncbi:MAG TPA: TonB-dependent receptor, partial [Bacteroidales bacterium]|nr:TonB-dependent receptor [Bacteroidales bacterium]